MEIEILRSLLRHPYTLADLVRVYTPTELCRQMMVPAEILGCPAATETPIFKEGDRIIVLPSPDPTFVHMADGRHGVVEPRHEHSVDGWESVTLDADELGGPTYCGLPHEKLALERC